MVTLTEHHIYEQSNTWRYESEKMPIMNHAKKEHWDHEIIIMIIMYNVISDWQSNGEVLCLACGVLCTRAQTLQRLNAVCHNPPTSSSKQLWEIQNNKRKLRRGLELWISKQGRRHLLQGENSSSTASGLSWNLNQKTARCDTIIIVALSEARPYQLGSHPHDHSYRFTRSEFSIQRCGWFKI